MTARDRTLMIRVVGDIQDASRSLQNMERKAGRFSRNMKTAGIAIAGAFAADRVLDFGKNVVSLGATVSNFEGTAKEVFGNVAEEALAASRAAEGIGLSRRQALEQLNYLGNLATATGATAEEALRLGDQTLSLSADLAAFSDVPTADVMEAIASATRGEYDALQRYLPTVSAATLEEVARTKGLIEEGEALTGAAALQAVYELAIRDGGAAIGAYARESDSATAAAGRLGAKWENFQATLGEKVLPLVERTVLWFETKLLPAIGQVVAFIQEHWPPIYDKYIKPAMEKARALVGAVVGFLADVWERSGDRIIDVVSAVWEYIKDAVKLISDVLGGLVDFLTAVFTGDWEAAWEAILDIGRGVLDFFIELPGNLLALVGAIAGVVIDIGAAIGKALVNGLIAVWNALDPSLSFTVPSWIPGIGGKSWTTGDIVPDIPYLAQGGIVRRPTLAVVGEAGPEAVVPLGSELGNVTINVEAGIGDPGAIADAVAEVLERYNIANGTLLRSRG